MKAERTETDYVKVSITWKLLLMHVHELTLENPNFRITSTSIVSAFPGCLATNAIGYLRKGRSYGMYTRDYGIIGTPHRYMITNHGKQRAEQLIHEQLEKDEFEQFKKDRDEAR